MDGKNIQELSFSKLELRIVKYLFRHYKDRYTPRSLARLLDLNHAHVNKNCSLLQKKGLLTKEDIGNADYYRFNYKEPLSIKFMEYLISLEEKEFPEWLQVPLHSIKQFLDHIEFGCVFGSSIRGKDFNDIDVLLVYDKTKLKMIEKTKAAIRNSELVEKPIRYVDVTVQDIQKNKDDKVFYSIISECLVFCHAEKYVEAIKNVAD
jgi:predicted nucleotidyltransferase